MDQAGLILPFLTSFPTRRSSDLAVIGSGVAVDLEDSLGLVDDDGSRSCCRLVVGVAVEGPVGCAAGNVGEAAAEMEQAGQRLEEDTFGLQSPDLLVCGLVSGVDV